MSTYPGAALVRVLGTGEAVQVNIVRAKAIYARSGIVEIGAGDIEVVVTFTTPLPDTNYTVPGLAVNSQNLTDPFLTARVSSILSATGFTVRLSAPTLSASMRLHWSVAEIYNP